MMKKKKLINFYHNDLMTWTEFWNNKLFRYEFGISLFALIISLILLSNFLLYNEKRSGVIIDDSILAVIPPADFTWLTFSLIYGGLIFAIIYLISYPGLLLITIQSYILLIIFRIVIMYSAPLEPPLGLIPLQDPFVEFFGTGQLLNKDLFFSGHTSITFLFYLIITKKSIKIIYLILTSIIGLLVLLQHVHYTIDILSAPFFAYGSYRLIYYFQNRIFNIKPDILKKETNSL